MRPPLPNPRFNTYSQGQGDVNSDGDPQIKTIAIRRLFKFEIQYVKVTEFHPVQKPQFTLVIPPGSCWLGTSLCQQHAEHLGLTNLTFYGLPSSLGSEVGPPHFMAWQTEAQREVISTPRTPRGNKFQSSNSNSELFDSKTLCVELAMCCEFQIPLS